jgi:hypothetical protein
VVMWKDPPISTVELCSSFRFIFGLFVASLINVLLAWSMSFCGRHHLGAGLLWCHILSIFFYNGFNDAPWYIQSFWYFFITQPWSVLLHNFVPDVFGELLGPHGAAWWCSLLSVVADSGAFRNRCIYTEIMWQIMWHFIMWSCDTLFN